MRVAVAGDHAGFALKGEAVALLQRLGHEVLDLGAKTYVPDDDYPDYAQAVAQAVARGEADRAVLICGSGVGASIAANKVFGVRAAVCHDSYSAHQGVEHDNMNVLCLGSRAIGPELAKDLIEIFLRAEFTNVERHVRRLGKVRAMERAFATEETAHG